MRLGARSRVAALAGLVLAGALVPAPARAQGIEPSSPAFWAASGAAFVAAVALDERLKRAHPDREHAVADALASLGYGLGGRTLLVPGFAAALTVAHVTGWPAESSRLLDAAVAVVAANVVTEGIKVSVGRGRPRHVDDPHQFRPFAGGGWKSFPSGHATTGFAVAAALSAEFELGAFEPAVWGLAGLVAWSRVWDDAHWTSDTVAGAVIGVATARTTMAWLDRRAAARDGAPAAPSPRLELGLVDGAPVVAVRVPVR